MTSIVIDKLLEDLQSCNLLLKGRPSASGIKYELGRLKKTLSIFQSVIVDAEERQGKDQAIRDWIKQTRLVCYDVDDVLHGLSTGILKYVVMAETEAPQRRANPSFIVTAVHTFSPQSKLFFYLLKMHHKVNQIRKKCDALTLDRCLFHLLMNRNIDRSSFLGRDEDIQRVTTLLLGSDDGEQDNNNNNVSVISIVGIRGLGKTALARGVYNSWEVRRHFDHTLWVSVFGVFNVERICKYKTLGERFGVVRMDKQLKKERKYLIVLDGVGDVSSRKWMELAKLLSSCAKGSKVLITAQTESAALAAKSTAIHFLTRLSSRDSWTLFTQNAFDQGQEPLSSALVEIGKEIVEMCAGVPLTIITAGSILRHQNNETDWLNFQKDELPRLLRPYADLAHIDKSSGPALEKQGTTVAANQTKYPSPLDENDLFMFQKDHLPQIVRHEHTSLSSDFCDSDQPLVSSLEMEGTIVAADQTENQIPLNSTDRDIDPILTLDISVDSRRASFLNLKLHMFHFSQLPDICKGQRYEGALFYSHDYLVSVGETVISGGKQVMVELDQQTLSKEAGSSSSLLPMKISDVAMWEDAILGISEAEPDEAPGEEKVVQSKEVVMIKISSLPDNPSFPNLTILLLQKDKTVRKLADSFFSNMPSLQILDLSETGLRSLPSSLFQLTSLEVLLLRDCNNLDNLQADIGDLRNMKALDVKGTELYNLPKEVNNLTKLELLRVSFYGAYDPSEYSSLPPELISSSTISKLHSLKALSIIIHPSDGRWKNQADALTHEVGSLGELTYLQFCFTEVRLVELFMRISPSWAKNTLCKFKFIVGKDIYRIVWRVPEKVVSKFDKQDRCLRYVNGNEIPGGCAGLLVRVTAFYLDHHCVTKNLSEFGHYNFMGLKFCVVSECPEVVEIINNSEGSDGAVLPNIQHLSLHYLWKLENLWKGWVPQGSFSCLKSLSVYACHKLEALLTRPLLRCFNKLEELVVEDCALLKVVIAREEDDEMVQSRDMFFPSMTNLNLHYLPELTNVWLGDCPLLKPTGISIIGCPKIAQHSGNSGEIVELNTT